MAAHDRHSVRAIRVAAVLYLIPAIAFGLGTPFVLRHLALDGELPTIVGIRALSGPFERLGQDGFTALGWALVASSALDALVGIWLVQGRRRGAWLGLAATPLSLTLGAGFALPGLLVALPVRVALILAGRRTLRD
jgi:hypothetical protein